MGSLQKNGPLEAFPLPRETWDLCLLFLEDSRTPDKPGVGSVLRHYSGNLAGGKTSEHSKNKKEQKKSEFLVLQRVHSVGKSQAVIPCQEHPNQVNPWLCFLGTLDWGGI